MFLFIIAYIFLTPASFAAEEKIPQTLEEINADLQAKKAALEPFDQKKVKKIDIESLGLDDVDKKTSEKKPEEKSVEITPIPADQKLPEIKLSEPIVSKDLEKLAPEKIIEEPKKTDAEQTGLISKIKNFLSEENAKKLLAPLTKEKKSSEEVKSLEKKAEAKKLTEQYINSVKKRNLKKRLILEKQRKTNEKKRQEKLKKLQELREKYLIKIEPDSSDQSTEYFPEDEEKIVPRKKEINQFISDEMPAIPILNRFRTSDNLHIPTIPTPAEKISTLFNTVFTGNVGLFNSAYKNVENPNVKNGNGDTILTYSMLLQKTEISASVLSKGADPNLPNGLGYSPMEIAIELFDFSALQLLINNNANIFYIDGFGRTHLMHAARLGFLSAVELLVSKGVDINAIDNDGFTALAIAHRSNKEIVVKFLLKNGAKTWIERPYSSQDQSLIKELENHWR